MRIAMMMIALAAISAESLAAMSLSEIRHEARFLSDRMGHELGLSNRQYEDVYEINFDFLYHVNEVIDDVVYGYDDAVDYYYYLLDVRNEDLMYVLRNRQYRKFVRRDYFYRPLYMVGHSWGMRIWKRYADRNYFYFGAPMCYHSYSGAHYRIHFAHSYYASMYHHVLFDGGFRLWGVGHDHRHHDGWRSAGRDKYAAAGSRPWHNANNYEQSRRDLSAGFVSIPSRDEGSRVVRADSEQSRRSAMSSGAASRSSASASASSSRSNSSASGSRSSSASASSSRSSASSSASSSRSSASSSRSSSASSARSSAASSSASSSRSSSASSSRSSASSSRSSAASSGKSAGSSASRSSSSSSRSSSSSSRSSSGNASRSGSR